MLVSSNPHQTATRRQPGQAFSEAYLERLYRMPRAMRWLEDWERLRHRDVDRLTAAELGKETYLARLRRALDHDAYRCEWLAEREAACRAELSRRGSRQ